MASFMKWASFGALALLSSTTVQASEELRIVSPTDLANQFSWNGQTGLIRETPALFGIPSYQTGVSGALYYSIPADGCSFINRTTMGVPQVGLDSAIIFIDRGECSFTQKVRNAGIAGFHSVIIGDNINEYNLPYMADDGTTPTVTTPSVMIGFDDANKLRTALQAGTSIVVTIRYSLPNPDNRVEWDLWTTSVDTLSASFKHTFSRAVKVLDYHALFTPHMYTIAGAGIHCNEPQSKCGNQCSNGGLYCAVDPERNTSFGLTGRDVIQENVRQICLYQALNTTGLPQYLWFDYVTQFDSVCGNACPGTPSPTDPDNPNCANGFSAQCSYAQMTALKLPQSLVEKCVAASGGTDTGSGINSILEAQITALQESSIFFIPTLTINLQPYRGSLNCDNTNCGPLSGICAGFIQGSLPLACRSSPGCNVGEVRDACGQCGGDGAFDACGQCNSVSGGHFNETCKGCDGVPNSGKRNDACGICEGPGTRMGSCLSSGSLAAIFIFTILAAIGIGIGVWYYLRRQSRVMRDDIDSLLKQYLPLEGGTNSSNKSQHARLVESGDDI